MDASGRVGASAIILAIPLPKKVAGLRRIPWSDVLLKSLFVRMGPADDADTGAPERLGAAAKCLEAAELDSASLERTTKVRFVIFLAGFSHASRMLSGFGSGSGALAGASGWPVEEVQTFLKWTFDNSERKSSCFFTNVMWFGDSRGVHPCFLFFMRTSAVAASFAMSRISSEKAPKMPATICGTVPVTFLQPKSFICALM